MSKEIYIVMGSEGEYDTYSVYPLKAFESEEEAKKYAENWINEITYKPAIDEDIWDMIEAEAWEIMDDNPKYMNEVKYSYPDKNDGWDERQEEVDKAITELYINFIMKKFEGISKEEATEMLKQQNTYIDTNWRQYNDPYIEKIELE